MDGIDRLQLRVVAPGAIQPHEVQDPARQRRIQTRLEADGILRDPLLVGHVASVEGYVLLDGTNRLQALHNLHATGALVQVVNYADEHAVQLRAWAHLARIPLANLLAHVATIPGTTLCPLAPLDAAEMLRTSGTLALLLGDGEVHALCHVGGAGTGRAAQLRSLVDRYENVMTRVDCDPDEVEERGRTLAARPDRTLVAFPPLSRAQVLTMAMRGERIPAGITRHVILAGRALRVNLPLQVLTAGDLESAQESLVAHLAGLQPRFYREPTVLFDS